MIVFLIGMQATAPRIAYVEDESPAAKAGLKQGDIVLAVNDKIVHSNTEFQNEIRRRLAGDTIKIEVSRDRKSDVVEL